MGKLKEESNEIKVKLIARKSNVFFLLLIFHGTFPSFAFVNPQGFHLTHSHQLRVAVSKDSECRGEYN
jgi:hypothetical protein